MNTMDITELNLFHLIQSYCDDLASVGGTTTSVVHLDKVEDQILNVVCSHCSAAGHTEAQCRRKGKSDKPCTYCGKKWHTESECFKKQKDNKRNSSSSSQSPAQQSGSQPSMNLANLLQQAAQQQSAVNSIQPQPAAPSGMSRETIMAMLDQLSSGCNCGSAGLKSHSV